MRNLSLTVTFTAAQTRRKAMCDAGLNPQVMGMKPGTRVERDRKLALKRGHIKHKARAFD